MFPPPLLCITPWSTEENFSDEREPFDLRSMVDLM